MVEPAAIVAAAQQVIRDRGVAGCTTREIALVAGCSEGSLYNHFASKDALIAAAVGDRFCAFPAQLHALPEHAGTGDVEANLRELAGSAISFFQHLLPLLGAMIADPGSMRARARTIDAQGHGPRWALRSVAEYLRREQELGRVRPDAAVEGAAQCLIGGCLQQALLRHVLDADLLPLDDATAAVDLTRAVLNGLQDPTTAIQE